MKEIRNLKGEVVRVEVSYGEKWWHLSASTWCLVLGGVLLIVGCFPMDWLLALSRVLDPRMWPWELYVLVLTVTAYLLLCWWIHRNWGDYDEDEEKHAKHLIGFGTTVVVILLFLTILSMSGRFFLFFRPLVAMLTRGRFTFAALWRLALVAVSFVPLIYFGKGSIFGFWDD